MTSAKPIRTFVALELNRDVRSALDAATMPLRRTGAHVSWVPAESLHLSLVFLGDIFPATVDLVRSALDEAAAASERFAFEVADLGTFGSGRSPRVIWAGVHGGRHLESLYQRLTGLLRALDLQIDSRPFRPHVTLGRVRSGRGRDALLTALGSAGSPVFGRVEATRIALMQSTLTPGRAIHSLIHAADLAG